MKNDRPDFHKDTVRDLALGSGRVTSNPFRYASLIPPASDLLGLRGATPSPADDPLKLTHSLGIKPHPSHIADQLLHNQPTRAEALVDLFARKAQKIGDDLITTVTLDEIVSEVGLSKRHAEEIILDLVESEHLELLPPPDTYRLNVKGEKLSRTPLIDQLHEATFTEPIGLQWVQDKYAFRMALRKAHCFTLDAETSALIADFSLAIVPDLDAARRLALPPFPTTWFEIDNHARLARIKERGIALTKTASRDDVIPRVGWLITTHGDDYYANYCCRVDQGAMIAPLTFHWHAGETRGTSGTFPEAQVALNDRLMFGVGNTGIHPYDAALVRAWPISVDVSDIRRQESELMLELSGELRHIWGLLIALGAGELGAISSTSPQAAHDGPPRVVKGKTLLPLEHKVLTIKLAHRQSAERIATKAITGAKKRWHEVRGHIRTLKNADGTVRARVPVKAHERGDKHLGVITKTYNVQK